MFSGIINDIGEITSIKGFLEKIITVKTSYDLNCINIGDSICCSGICLTVIQKFKDSLNFCISQETIECTTAKNWEVGDKINLEKSLKFGQEISGHLVLGHIDCVSEILEIKPVNDSYHLAINTPLNLEYLISKKGSITIDGVSLTVNEVNSESFHINLIPHTYENTCFSTKKNKDKVNIEIDVMARYIARQMEKYNVRN